MKSLITLAYIFSRLENNGSAYYNPKDSTYSQNVKGSFRRFQMHYGIKVRRGLIRPSGIKANLSIIRDVQDFLGTNKLVSMTPKTNQIVVKVWEDNKVIYRRKIKFIESNFLHFHLVLKWIRRDIVK